MKIGTTLISSIEFHGNMSLVIFLATCPLRCPYCSNGELLEYGDEIDLEEIFKIIDDSKDFIDAVVVSGGEPLLQIDDVIAILKYVRELGLKTKLDTSGVYPSKIKELLELNLIDYVAMDIKAPFDKYFDIIGADIGDDVKNSMNLIREYDEVFLECRTTYCPALLNEDDIYHIAKEIHSDLYTIQQFRNRSVLDHNLDDVEEPNPQTLERLAKEVKPFLDNENVKVKTSEFGEELIK